MAIVETKMKRAARTVIIDENEMTAVIDVRGGEYYKIPGGGIEEGETEIEAAKREALEEAGSVVEIIEKIGDHEFIDQNPQYEGMIHHSICFLAKKTGEHEDPSFDEWEKKNRFKLLWVSFEEALKLFASSNTNDLFGKEINKRDWDFLNKGIEIYKKNKI